MVKKDNAKEIIRSSFLIVLQKSPELLNVLEKLPSLKDLANFYGMDSDLSVLFSNLEMAVAKPLKEIESEFEYLLESDEKRLTGIVYTPDYIVDFIIRETIRKGLAPTREAPLIDPACGSGAFLIRAAYLISELSQISFHEASEMIAGLDVSEGAVLRCRYLLDIACLAESGLPSKARIEQADSLLSSIEEQKKVLNAPSGFSCVVTNPPYVKLQNLSTEYAAQLIEDFPDIAGGAFSLANIFIYQAPRYLAKGGMAGMITLNNIFTSLAGEKLRIYWDESRSVSRIIDFRHFTVFSASAYTCLLFLTATKNESIEFNATSIHPAGLDLDALQPSQIPYSKLNYRKWRLAERNHLSIVEKLETLGAPLKEIAEIKVGFATLCDKAFVGSYVDGAPIFTGNDGKRRELEIDSIFSYIKVSELDDSDSPAGFVRPIIYPYVRTSIDRPLIPIEQFQELYPQAFLHLMTWEKELKRRDLSDDLQWHAWGRRQSLISEGPKLLTKTFDIAPNFRLDISNSLFANGYSVKPKAIMDAYDIHALKRFLESRLVHAYALVTSFEISGGYQCYQKNFIEKLTLPSNDFLNQCIENEVSNGKSFESQLLDFYEISAIDLEKCLHHYLGTI
jgi:hypothetical protein